MDTTDFSQYTQSQEESVYVLLYSCSTRQNVDFIFTRCITVLTMCLFRDILPKDEKDQPVKAARDQLKVN